MCQINHVFLTLKTAWLVYQQLVYHNDVTWAQSGSSSLLHYLLYYLLLFIKVHLWYQGAVSGTFLVSTVFSFVFFFLSHIFFFWWKLVSCRIDLSLLAIPLFNCLYDIVVQIFLFLFLFLILFIHQRYPSSFPGFAYMISWRTNTLISGTFLSFRQLIIFFYSEVVRFPICKYMTETDTNSVRLILGCTGSFSGPRVLACTSLL